MGASAFQGVEPNVFDLLDKDRIAVSDKGREKRPGCAMARWLA
jgi:hypothetical protein